VGWTKRKVKEPKVKVQEIPLKNVWSYKQQDGGHGSWNPLRSV